MCLPVRSKKMAVLEPAQKSPRSLLEVCSKSARSLLGGSCGSWTYPAENGPHRSYDRSNFLVGPTRTDGRVGRRGLGAGDPANGGRSGAPVADAASQSRRSRPASGRARYADMVAPGHEE